MEQIRFKNEILPMRKKLINYAQKLLENAEDAEDIIQEVFLKLWHMRDKLDQYDSVPALTMTMTKHLCFNMLKVRQRKFEEPNDINLTSHAISPYQELEEKDDVGQLMSIIGTLPDLQQAVLRMKHVDGFEVEEIAELTGSNCNAVRMNLSRARRKVKELFLKV